jgi:hypothetical protein
MCFTAALDGIFQRRRDAMRAAVALIGRHEVGDVAHHEHSPGPASKITSGETRESQQPTTITAGDWPRSDSSR